MNFGQSTHISELDQLIDEINKISNSNANAGKSDR